MRQLSNTRKAAYLLCLVVLLVGTETQGLAQSEDAGAPPGTGGAPTSEEGTGLTVTLVKAGGEDFSDQMRVGTPIGLSACIEGTIDVTISGLPSSPAFPYLEVWYGSGAGACNEADRATRVSSAQNCTKLEAGSDGQPIDSFNVLDTKVQIAPICDLNAAQTTGARQGPQTLWFLLLRSQGSAEAAMFYRSFTINVDTVAPSAPAPVTAGSAESDLTVSWAPVPSARSYWVIADLEGALTRERSGDVDAGTAADGCDSRSLRQGERVDLNEAETSGLLIRETSETEITFDGNDFDDVARVPVAVVAQDLAGNLSVLSEVRCITVTDENNTPSPSGEGAPGTTDLGCSCSVPGAHGNGASSGLAAFPIGLLLVGSYVLRRSRRRTQ